MSRPEPAHNLIGLTPFQFIKNGQFFNLSYLTHNPNDLTGPYVMSNVKHEIRLKIEEEKL